MTFSKEDSLWMAKAIQLAYRGLYTTDPNPRVGCLFVKANKVIGQGWHERAGEAHAEINALNDAEPEKLKGATAYVTLEPCFHTGKTPPCSNALISAGIKRIVIAMLDPNPLVAGKSVDQLRNANILVDVGLLADQARELNPGFISRMERGRPFVRVKLGASLDGRSAMKNGESQWITSPSARRDVQFYRARASAILTSSGTVNADNPSLNVRLSASELGIDGSVRQPLRVVLDSSLSTSIDCQIYHLSGETKIITKTPLLLKKQMMQNLGVEVITMDDEAGVKKLPLHRVMQLLAERQINEVHVEAGEILCGALLENHLIDELIIYLAPKLMGSSARGLFDMPTLKYIKDSVNLDIIDMTKVGNDIRFTAIPI